MDTYKGQFLGSIMVGTAGFLLLLLPALVVQYRRYGRLSGARLVGTAALCVYGTALIVFTMFPLPTIAEACHGRTGPILQDVPFHFLDDLRAEAHKTSWRHALRSFVVMQVVLNVALFVPLGMLARRFFGRGLILSTLLGFVVSLGIEATQYTGIWGIYPCGYRVADVDDLIANTAGAAIGAIIAPIVLGWMPQARQLEDLAPAPVSALRRWVGMIADWMLIGITVMCLEFGDLAVRALLAEPERVTSADITALEHAGAAAIAGLLIVCLPALQGTGASAGQRLVRIAPRWTDARGATLGRRLGRASIVGGTYTASLVLAPLAEAAQLPVLPGAIRLVAGIVVTVGVIWVAFGDHRGLSGAATGAHMVDVRSLRPRVDTMPAWTR